MWVILLLGALVVIACTALAWPVRRWHLQAVSLTCVASGTVMVAGVVAGLPLFPLSDAVVLAFAVTGGVLLGRAVRTGVVPFLIVLVVLSVLDVAMNALFTGGPPAPAGAPPAPDPHLIWLNFRVPLPSGHFNIGFGDLLLIAAMSVHLRSRSAGHMIAAAPGVIGLGLALLFAACLTLSSCPRRTAVRVAESLPGNRLARRAGCVADHARDPRSDDPHRPGRRVRAPGGAGARTGGRRGSGRWPGRTPSRPGTH